MAAGWLGPGDERLLWELLVREPGFNLPALHLFEAQGMGASARFAVVRAASGPPLLGAAGLGHRWYLFGEPSAPPSGASDLAPLLAEAGVASLEGEERLIRAMIGHPTLSTLLAVAETHIVAAAGPPPPPDRSPAPPSAATGPSEGAVPEPEPPDHPGARVRKAGVGDVPAVERLYHDHGEPVDRAALAAAAGAGTLWVAAVAGGELVGAAMAPVRTALAAWIGGVFTHPAHRGRGIASALVTALTRTLQAEGLAVYLLYRPGGPARLYARLGFSSTGVWARARRRPSRPGAPG